MAAAPPATSYDTVLYPSLPFQQTHPTRIAAIARLHGVPAAAPGRCRVLELGAGDGWNLIPMALAYPDSEFVGVDLAPTPVAKGNAAVAALGVTNCRLIAADICALGDELGQFDYVVAHGVFSWVPEEVRLALLALCQRALTPTGVGYVSYNAYPGCHVREVFWDMARLHTRSLTDPPQKIRQARAVLDFLAEGLTVSGPLGAYMREEARHLARERQEAVLYHDDLAGINRPYYFHEFAALAAQHGLQFLAEAEYADMDLDCFPPAVADQLAEMGEKSVVLQQQYRDFLKLRRFRQTLLVRDDVEVDRYPVPARVRELAVATETRPAISDPSLDPGVAVEFKLASAAAVTVDHPFAKAALHVLARRWPHPLGFDDLAAEAARLLDRADGEATDHERQVLSEVLLAAFTGGLAVFYADPPRTAPAAGDRPRLSRFARHQLDAGEPVLTNLLHVPVKIDDPVTRRLLGFMDGTRDRATVVEALTRWAVESAAGEGKAVSAEELRGHYAGRIDEGFAKAAELALLAE